VAQARKASDGKSPRRKAPDSRSERNEDSAGAQAERVARQWGERATRAVARYAALAREELEDIWAEAANRRRRR
jgi:hypothetical protein